MSVLKVGKQLGAVVIAMSLGVAAFAHAEINGDYTNDDTGITLRVISLNATTAAAQVIASGGNCEGDVSGVGKVAKNTLKFDSYTTLTSKCTITVWFNPDGTKANVSEQGCRDWHGVACSFDGMVAK